MITDNPSHTDGLKTNAGAVELPLAPMKDGSVVVSPLVTLDGSKGEDLYRMPKEYLKEKRHLL